MAIEYKVDGGKLMKLQEYKLYQIAQAGGFALEVNPHNADETMKLLTAIANGEHHDPIHVESPQ